LIFLAGHINSKHSIQNPNLKQVANHYEAKLFSAGCWDAGKTTDDQPAACLKFSRLIYRVQNLKLQETISFL